MLKKTVCTLLLVAAVFFCASAAFAASESDSDSMLELLRKPKMSVSSGGISDGVIGSEYGKRGRQQRGGVPALSLPITIKDAPDKTVCYAILMTDPDSNPLWTHWLAVNIHSEDLPENAAIDMAKDMAQGKNDFGAIGYGGPTPPNGRHTYVITVYALDAEVNLSNGFSKKQFADAIDGHILAKAEVKGSYQ
ncbi:hypothetical protein FACS1894167_08500 [Synergistales bacterium]|nr:hypothetical protein FACS1894167_08500 [Synergistales bacterium]